MTIRFDSKKDIIEFFQKYLINDEEIIKIILILDDNVLLKNEKR